MADNTVATKDKNKEPKYIIVNNFKNYDSSTIKGLVNQKLARIIVQRQKGA